jgi:hypothetical protein
LEAENSGYIHKSALIQTCAAFRELQAIQHYLINLLADSIHNLQKTLQLSMMGHDSPQLKGGAVVDFPSQLQYLWQGPYTLSDLHVQSQTCNVIGIAIHVPFRTMIFTIVDLRIYNGVILLASRM